MNAIIVNGCQQSLSVYLDAQATELPRPEAIAAALVHMSEGFGNPSATSHGRGRQARGALESARESIGHNLNASADGIIFTSGATEANNLALRSFAKANGGNVVVSQIEHKSVLAPAEQLASFGKIVKLCPVLGSGLLSIGALSTLISGDTQIVSVMHANNELGTIQPIDAVVEACRGRGVLCHVDASQTAGRIPVDFDGMGVDMLTISGHKFGGLAGVGALIIKPELIDRIVPQIVGGGQERGLRAGTTPVAQCVAMAAALEASVAAMVEERPRLASMRDQMLARLRKLPGFFTNGDFDQRLPCNINGGFDGVDALALMRAMPNVHFAAGSACTTGAAHNHVLDAIGLSPARQKATFRVSLSWSNSENDILSACDAFERALNVVRGVVA